jgi:hypothetical protein
LPGTPKFISFKPVVSSFLVVPEVKKRRMPQLGCINEKINFVEHNKEALVNVKAVGSRPVAEQGWVKHMRRAAAIQRRKSMDDDRGEREKMSGLRTVRDNFWKTRPEFNLTLQSMDFKEFSGEMTVDPTYSYCGCCKRNSSPLTLKGKDLRIKKIAAK